MTLFLLVALFHSAGRRASQEWSACSTAPFEYGLSMPLAGLLVLPALLLPQPMHRHGWLHPCSSAAAHCMRALVARRHMGPEPCRKLHFRKIIHPWTDERLGNCSYLNTCRNIRNCKCVRLRARVEALAHWAAGVCMMELVHMHEGMVCMPFCLLCKQRCQLRLTTTIKLVDRRLWVDCHGVAWPWSPRFTGKPDPSLHACNTPVAFIWDSGSDGPRPLAPSLCVGCPICCALALLLLG